MTGEMDMLRWRVLRAFGVAPWSEDAAKLTDEMCLEYAVMLDMESESGDSAAFDGETFEAMEAGEVTADIRETAPISKRDVSAMSDYIEREMRIRDTGFAVY